MDIGQLTLDADGERGRDIRRLAGTQPPPSSSLLEQAIQMSTFFMEKTTNEKSAFEHFVKNVFLFVHHAHWCASPPNRKTWQDPSKTRGAGVVF